MTTKSHVIVNVTEIKDTSASVILQPNFAFLRDIPSITGNPALYRFTLENRQPLLLNLSSPGVYLTAVISLQSSTNSIPIWN